MTRNRIYLQPLPVRIWHWLNAFGIIILCLTGAQIRYPEYVQIFASYRSSILLHNAAGIVVGISFSLWFFYYRMVAGNILDIYLPTTRDITTGLFRQGIFYCLTYFCGAKNPHHPTPQNKFNPLQKSAYLAVMFVVMPLVTLTGLFLINVTPLREIIISFGGLTILITLHFLLACCLCAFLCTHVYLATLGKTPTAYLKPMWTGWEEIEEEGKVQH